MKYSLIVAADEADVIGRDGELPWHLPDDMRRFKALTLGHAVVVGRRTQDSIVARLGRPLPGRISVVVTRDLTRPNDGPVIYQPSVASALSVATAIEEFAGRDQVFVIGGAAVYAEALPHVHRVELTRVHTRVDGDTVMPAGWLNDFFLVEEQKQDTSTPPYSWLRYERR